MTRLGIWLLLFVLSASVAEACSGYTEGTNDLSGNMVSDVSVTVFFHNTTNAATLYSDPDCTDAISNPVTSSSRGVYEFWVQDGIYDLQFSRSGYSFENVTALFLFEPMGQHIKFVSYFNTTDICAATEGAIAAIGSTVTTLVINKAVTCSTTATIPSTLTLLFLGQGQITVASGQTLTVNGPILAAAKQIFAGSGTTSIGTNAPLMFSQWTGGSAAGIKIKTTTFANLGTAEAGMLVICTDCTKNQNPCTGSGSGSLAFAIASAWICPTFP